MKVLQPPVFSFTIITVNFFKNKCLVNDTKKKFVVNHNDCLYSVVGICCHMIYFKVSDQEILLNNRKKNEKYFTRVPYVKVLSTLTFVG